MRQPTFSRSRRARQQRLLRTGIGVVVLVAVAAGVASIVGGGNDEPADGDSSSPAVPTIHFTASFQGEGDEKPSKDRVKKEGEAIVAMLDAWYQEAFVDPSRFGDGTFPTVAAMFEPDARAQFAKDLTSLTIGEARGEVSRVEPKKATAAITVYFENGKDPRFAVADVRFRAQGVVKAEDGFPLDIDQKATLHLRRTAKGWLVAWYTADQKQRSIAPTPSPSGGA